MTTDLTAQLTFILGIVIGIGFITWIWLLIENYKSETRKIKKYTDTLDDHEYRKYMEFKRAIDD